MLDMVLARTPTKVTDFFHVHQGIRSGAKKIFLQPLEVVDSLPNSERKYFKLAVETASFVEGKIEAHSHVFLADEAWKTEADVKESMPVFFGQYLLPARGILMERRSLKDKRWWRLTRARATWLAGGPRLLSKRFGLYPAFARDFDARFAPVQANAWKPTGALETRRPDILRDLLTSYWWLLNSRVAVSLFREYCPNVAGGQLDLEHKYVRHVPLPDLTKEFEENPDLQKLATSLRTRYAEELPRLADRDKFSAAAYGTSVSDWNLAGLESRD
jgi:hypothetical protein